MFYRSFSDNISEKETIICIYIYGQRYCLNEWSFFASSVAIGYICGPFPHISTYFKD